MQKVEKRFTTILKKIKSADVSSQELCAMDAVNIICGFNKARYHKKMATIFPVLFSILCLYAFICYDSECFIKIPVDTSKIFRQPESCGMCKNLYKVDKVANISTSDFNNNYLSKSKPVVVTDGTNGWSAIGLFSFDFFKNLYLNADTDNYSKKECQFFPYKTEFKSLKEVLNMSTQRSRLAAGTSPWYVGWSNCNDEAGRTLRKHYGRPYFLPAKSENIALSWIFMGGPGYGAHIHVDNVQHPSWQAQLSGKKSWRLVPPPECLHECEETEVVVEQGEIIVVDTNRWYHQTKVLPGDISITIGAEFD